MLASISNDERNDVTVRGILTVQARPTHVRRGTGTLCDHSVMVVVMHARTIEVHDAG